MFYSILLCNIVLVLSDQACKESKGCIGQTLTDPGLTRALGYKSAYGATTSFSGGSIYCDGSRSCDSMLQMTAKTGDIVCKARDSCTNTSIETNSETPTIYCHGTHSCSYSNITSTNTVNLRCNGYQSCRNTYIHSVELIDATGSLSLYKSIIDTEGIKNNTIDIILQGSLAGFGAKLICRHNHTCHINCNTVDGCSMFYAQCIGQCTITSLYDNAILPITNLTQFNNLNTDIIPSHFASEAIVFSDDESCTTETLTFDDYQERLNGKKAIIANELVPICCRGSGSCQTVSEIRANNDILCTGRQGCYQSNLLSNNGTIYCEGQSSCDYSSITGAHNVYCTGAWSCRGSTVINVHNILCYANVGCTNATLVSAGSDLNAYFNGGVSGKGVTIYCNATDSCNVYCGGADSCEGAVLYCRENCNVECDTNATGCPIVYGSTPPTESPSLNSSENPSLNPTLESLLVSNDTYISTTDTVLSTDTDTIHSSNSTDVDNSASNPTLELSTNQSEQLTVYPYLSTLQPLLQSNDTDIDAIHTSDGTDIDINSVSNDREWPWTIVSVIFIVVTIALWIWISIQIYRRITKCKSEAHLAEEQMDNNMDNNGLDHVVVDNSEPDVDECDCTEYVRCQQCGVQSSKLSIETDTTFICKICKGLDDEMVDEEVDKMFVKNKETKGYGEEGINDSRRSKPKQVVDDSDGEIVAQCVGDNKQNDNTAKGYAQNIEMVTDKGTEEGFNFNVLRVTDEEINEHSCAD